VPVVIPADHFSTGVWRATGPLRLSGYSCTQCGLRSASWGAYRAHRAVCTGSPEGHAARTAALDVGDRDALRDLLAQLPEVA
jgi:hypothetical protein